MMLKIGETVRIKNERFLRKYPTTITEKHPRNQNRPFTGVVTKIIPEIDGSMSYGVVCDIDKSQTVWYYSEEELEQGTLCWISKEANLCTK